LRDEDSTMMKSFPSVWHFVNFRGDLGSFCMSAVSFMPGNVTPLGAD